MLTMEVDHQQQQQQHHQEPTPTETTSTVEAESTTASSTTTSTTLAQDSKIGNGGDDNVVDDKNDNESAVVVEQEDEEENLELEEAKPEAVKPKIDDVLVADNPSTFPSGAVNEEQKHSTPLSMPPTAAISTTTTTTAPQKSIALQKEQFKFIQGVLRGLKRHPQASPFLVPVDPVALNIPNYTSIVLCPSDLQSIQKKMDSSPVDELTSISTYTPELFEADVRLIFSNCLLFNGPENPITKMSFLLEKYFNNTMAKMPLSEKVNTPLSAGAASFSDSYTSPKRMKRPPALGTKLATPKGPVRKALTPEMQFCSQILKELTKKSNLVISWPFLDPVDPVKLNIPDYFNIIKNPMDLNKVRSKLMDTKEYSSSDEFEGDIRLIISNCLLYNGTESDVATMCRGFERLFDDLWATKPDVFPLPPPPKRQQSSQQSGNIPIYHQHQQQHHHQYSGDSDSQRIFELNNKIQVLQAELNGLLMRSAGIVSPAGGAGGYLSPSGGSHSSIASATSHTSSSAPKRSRKKPSAPRTSSPSVSGRAASASATPVSEEQFLSTPMTFEEKSVLSQQVNELDPDRLGRVVEIIQAGMSLEAQGDSDVIELDIESLPVRTLRELQRFVLSATKGITDLSAMLGGAGAKASNAAAPAAAAAAIQPTSNDTRPAGMISSDDEKDNAEEDSDEDSDEE